MDGQVTRVPSFCPLCVSKCGAMAVVDDGRLVALEPDPDHPTGRALCVKGKAAPSIVHHPDRLLHPLRRTNPKGAPDPGWERIGWDEALGEVADRLRAIAEESGPEAVVFGSASPSTSAMNDSIDWVMRLKRAFGSPNLVASMELCGWGRYLAPMYTFGMPVPGAFMPDLERAGCILYWGYNPSVARLAHATATLDALRRGAKLVVVDPRKAGLASKADHWLRVRPGTDAALALAITGVLLSRGWYDAEFCRRWTNAPLLVRGDTGRLLRSEDLAGHLSGGLVAWSRAESPGPVRYDPGTQSYGADEASLAVDGRFELETVDGRVACRPVLAELAAHCPSPQEAAELTDVPAEQIEAVAQTLWESRPLAFYTWSGLEQHSGTTQMARAIHVLYALLGDLDAPGGNVLFTPVPTNLIDGRDLVTRDQLDKEIGLEPHPLGPPRFEFITGPDFYDAALEAKPYRARALVNFGQNLVMAQADSGRGRDALTALDFFVHADLFASPTADLADIVLPVAAPWEVEALRVGFEVSQEAQSLVQLRRPIEPPAGEARSDLQIVFALATRLGLGEQFWDGDIDGGWQHQLAPSGITLEQLRAEPAGVRLPLETRHRKYAARGFPTPSGKVELFSETLTTIGQPALPTYVEPATSPRSRPDLAQEFPLVLTCAKSLFFAESQHRQVADLRRSAPDPLVELHPDAAAQRGIAAGDWVRIVTPHGSVRSRAKLTANLDPAVVVAQHGWWQGCDELGLPAMPPYGPDSANLNLVLRATPGDPVSGSSPLRSTVCDVEPATGPDRKVTHQT